MYVLVFGGEQPIGRDNLTRIVFNRRKPIGAYNRALGPEDTHTLAPYLSPGTLNTVETIFRFV